jgi:hypothetical protein
MHVVTIPQPSKRFASMTLIVERRVTRITAPILRPDVHDHYFRAFRLQLQRCNKCVFTGDDNVAHLTFELETNGELHLPSPCNLLKVHKDFAHTTSPA